MVFSTIEYSYILQRYCSYVFPRTHASFFSVCTCMNHIKDEFHLSVTDKKFVTFSAITEKQVYELYFTFGLSGNLDFRAKKGIGAWKQDRQQDKLDYWKEEDVKEKDRRWKRGRKMEGYILTEKEGWGGRKSMIEVYYALWMLEWT